MHGWAMSQKLPLGGLKWVEETSQVNKNFIKRYNKESVTRYFLEIDVQYPEEWYGLHKDLLFLPERIKIVKVEKLVTNLHIKKICYTYKKFKTSIKSRVSIAKSS